MKARISTAGLARISARHPWRTLGLWFVMIIIAAVLASGLGGALDDTAEFTNNPESERGSELIEERLFSDEPLTETVVVTSNDASVDDPAFQATVEETFANLLGLDEVVASAATYYEMTDAGDAGAATLVSEDRHTTIIPVTLTGTYDDLEGYAKQYVETAEEAGSDAVQVYTVGDLSGNEVYSRIANEDLVQAETIGLPVALLVLIAVFGALVAAGLPIILGLVSIVVAMGLTAGLSQVLTIGSTVMTMITMIGLAVGIDYSLFFIERYREERRHGLGRHESIELAGGTAGKAVLFSGLTVVLALLGMFLLPISIFQSLAAGAILAVLVAVVATQTLVPALLALLGDRINWPRRKVKAGHPDRFADDAVHNGFWGKITRAVMRRPVVSIVLAVGLLLAAALPVTGLETGQSGLESLPESNVKTGYEILERDFYAGVIAPVEIVVDGSVDDPAVQQGITDLTAALAADETFGPASSVVSDAGNLTLITLPMGVDPNSTEAYDAIDDLRGEVIPGAFGDLENNVYVTGATASTADFNDMMTTYTPYVFIFVLALSFVLLMAAFRSIVVPFTAIIMNLLSVGAAYGLLVAVFQNGFLADQLGFIQTDNITTWIPVFLFSVLFGLSMDYHVFLLSRIREHYDRSGRNAESVAVGLQSTAKIITGAALIMVAVFGAFASGRLVEIQQMGFGLAIAILLDATIIRSVLVPATMTLLGDRNWYLPSWLSWLPDFRVEGEPAAAPVAMPVPAEAAAGD